ncbi:MAG: FecCD family ABC transporter permease [Rhizobacter sp.]|jgi:iron complex transport system permease protein
MNSSVLEPGVRVLRWGGLSVLLAGRPMRAAVLSGTTLLMLCGLAMAAGSTWLGPGDLLTLLRGEASPATALLVWEFRWPRIVVAMLCGALLGLAGLLLQTLMHNRLAAPDLMGVSDGASLAMLLALIAGGTGLLGPWWIAVTGAVGATALLLGLSGGIGTRGQRVLVVGLAVAALLHALTELLLSRQTLQHAAALYAWSIGSLQGRGDESVPPLATALALVAPGCAYLGRRLALLQLDPDLAAALGLSLRATQWQALGLATVAAGLAVAVCGPVAFVALAAPLIAVRLAGGGVPCVGAALAGAALVLAADTAGRILLPSAELPVGVICNLLGGPFLLWLLHRKTTA